MVTWKEVGQLIGKSAPLLGGIISGPAGTAMGEIVSSAFGVKSTPDDVINAINADPQSALKLIEIQNERRSELENNVLQYFIEENADRADARSMNVKLAEVGKDQVIKILAYGILVIYAIIQLCVIFHVGQSDDLISARVQDLMMIIVGFYFGSSYGSKMKDNLIDRLHSDK